MTFAVHKLRLEEILCIQGRYQHVVPLAWLSGSAPPLVSNGSHVPYVEAGNKRLKPSN